MRVYVVTGFEVFYKDIQVSVLLSGAQIAKSKWIGEFGNAYD